MTYKIQIDDEIREANADETAALDAQKAEAKAQAKAVADKATAKAALLDRLGITADEAALLLG
jgi:hypothetical protein